MSTPGFLEILCPVCREPVPDKGFRRVRVPSQGGRRGRVCSDECAAVVEAQATLLVDEPGKVAAA